MLLAEGWTNKDIAEAAFRLYDTSEGHQQLSLLINKWLNMGYENIYCGVESTGGYENNWVNYLQELGKARPVHIARLNPKGVKALGEARMTRTVTDSVNLVNKINFTISPNNFY